MMMSLAVVAAGCNPLGITRSEDWLLSSDRYDVITDIPVPRVRGPSGCGAQALAAAMCQADPELDPQAECDALPWHDAGANVIEIRLTARAKGFQAKVIKGSWELLADLVERGRPPMVMFDRNLRIWSPFPWLKPPNAMHWGVVSGMSRDGKTLLCAAPNGRHYLIERRVFMECWEPADLCTVSISKKDASPGAVFAAGGSSPR